MSRFLRTAGSGVALALALGIPASAELQNQRGYPWHPRMSDGPPGGTATAVVIRISGGFHPSERWVWYDADGTVRLKGVVNDEHGLFRSTLSFADVARIVDEAGLCTRPGTPYRRVGMDMFVFHLHVRCGNEWRSLSTGDIAEPDDAAQASRAVHALRRLTERIAWKPSTEDVAPPDRGGLFHTAAAQTAPAAPPASPDVLTTPHVLGPPTAAIIRVVGGIVPHDRWLWFDGDGTARLRGMLVDGGGRFKSHVDFSSVRQILDDANACTANPSAATFEPPPIGSDMISYQVDVRCGTRWHLLRRFAQAGSQRPNASNIVAGLEAIAYKLSWEPTDETVALPDAVSTARFAAPR